jgi:hypothetical protein
MPEIDIARLLTASDPAARLAPTAPGLDHALDALGAAIAAAPVSAPGSRRPSRPLVAVGLAVVAILVGVGVATGGILSARTGIIQPPSEVPIGGPGELLNPAAPDFRSVALQIGSDVPYPSGDASWRERVVTLADDPNGLISSGALHGEFAMSAFCAWVRDWDKAVGADDEAEAATAAATIAQAPSWKAVAAEDPHPDPNAVNDPGAETGTIFGWLLPYRAAVLAGDRARVEHLLATGYGDGRCWLYAGDPPPQAGQPRARHSGSTSPTETTPP